MESQQAFPLAEATRTCMSLFNALKSSSETAIDKFKAQLPSQVVRDQQDRFKLWATNLGALQRGRASLDFRLMDSSLMHSTVYKLLKELENTIKRSEQVVTGSRPPLEETLINDMDDSSGYSSESGSSDDGGYFSRVPVKQTELGQNTAEINHILSSLVKLSFRIRGPANRTAHLDHKALNHKELVSVDGTTMGDLLEAYSTLDRQHVEETLRQLRKNQAAVEIYDDLHVPAAVDSAAAEKSSDATKYHHDGDNVDTVSTISYVSTAFGDDGTSELPAPPLIKPDQLEFVCPYCHVLCAAREGRGRRWREHILRDLQPYMCTYADCTESSAMHSSKAAWLEHESRVHHINSKASSSPDIASLKLDDPFEEDFQDKQESEDNPPDPNNISNDEFALNYYLRQRHPGTWQWFLNSTGHQTWLSHAGEKRLVLGVPGVGKSVLASVVLEDLRQRFGNDKSIGVVGLFCEVYKEEGITGKLIRSFLTQLRGPEKSDFTQVEEKSDLPVDKMSMQDLSTGSRLSRVFVVVDGLDLRARDTEFILWLLDIAGQPKVSVLFTSRIIPTIHNAILDFPIQDLRATEADISAYARKSLTTAMTSNIYPGQLEELEERTVTFAEGVFLFAKAHIDALKDSQRMEYLSNLALLQNSRAINDFYKKIMLRVQQSKMGNTLSAWMAHSDYILEKPQAQNLIGFILNDCASDSGTFLDVNAVISSCAGLVLESSENCLTFFHHTTEEYFRQTRDTWFPDAAEEQTEICCKYLSMDAFAAGPCLSDDEWEERLLQHPFYIHAALAWGLYARKALDKHKDATDTGVKDRIRGAIMGFLRRDVKVQAAVQALKVDDTEAHSSGWSQVYPKQWTNIHLAAYFGLTEILDTMLPEDGVLWDTSIDGVYSPIIVAAERGHHSTLSFMLGKLIDRSGRLLTGLYGMVGHLALAGAAQNGHEPNVRLLLTYGADPNGISGSITPLSYAVEDGHTNVVETLLEYGADPNLKTEVEGPLDLAVKNGREDIVTLLIKHGASLDKKGSAQSGSTTLQHINPEIVPFMLKDGVGVNYRNDDGFTALHISAISGHIDTVRILLNHGADATIVDNSGATPLDYAIDGGHEEVVNLILENGSEFQGLVDSIADHVS
ncbi:Ankyrin-3 [Colletotrichum fructicola]|nr:Ankyrin-3 [Colletotrichum fructicola]